MELELESQRQQILLEKKNLEESKKIFEEEKRRQEELIKENIRKEEMRKEMEKLELEKKKLIEGKKILEEEKRIQEMNYRERKREEEEQRIKEELEKNRKKINEEKKLLEEKQKELEEEKKKLEQEKLIQEKLRKEFELKKLKEKEKEIQINPYPIKTRNLSATNSDKNSINNNRELTDRKTIRDSEMENEVLIINNLNTETPKEELNNKNNYILGSNPQLNDYQKFYNKEVTNKIKYELEKDLINKQKQFYNNDKSEQNKENKKHKLVLLDLENEQNNQLKEVENILKGGITNKKLNQLEEKYKYNKEIIEMINSYKIKISQLENNNKIKNSSINNNELNREIIIKNKLKIYKEKISKQFLEKVEKEKKNEYKRIQILNKINDKKLKEDMEAKFAIERGKIDMELTKEKENINKAIKDYEKSLLESNNLDIVSPKNNFFYE